MTAYVDDVEYDFGRMKMCHLWADSLEELYAMVDRIGVQRRWIQGHPELSIGKAKNASWLHFDISKGKKSLAIRAGAVLTDMFGPTEFLAKQDAASADPELAEWGRKKLADIARSRVWRKQRDEGDLL